MCLACANYLPTAGACHALSRFFFLSCFLLDPMLVPVPETDRKKQGPEEAPEKEMITKEHFEMLCNPSAHAFKQALNAFISLPSSDAIDQMHMPLLLPNASTNPQIIGMINGVLPFLDCPEFHDKLCIMLSDFSHFNQPAVKQLLLGDIFVKLDYSRSVSFSLVFNICDGNKEAWEIFSEQHMRPEFRENEYIKRLSEC